MCTVQVNRYTMTHRQGTSYEWQALRRGKAAEESARVLHRVADRTDTPLAKVGRFRLPVSKPV